MLADDQELWTGEIPARSRAYWTLANGGERAFCGGASAIAEDAPAHLARLRGEIGGVVRLPDGTEVPRLPGVVLWIWDDVFCGAINLRYQPGTEALPPHVSGHVGYAVVPWKQRQGHATRALGLLLPIAQRAGCHACC